MPIGAAALFEAPKDHYALERQLGRGGMATVYLARDLRYDRLAAVRREEELRRAQGDTTGLRPDIAEQSARMLVLAGRKDEAVDSLAVTLADTTYPYTTPAGVSVDPFWRPLRGLKRFEGLVAKP